MFIGLLVSKISIFVYRAIIARHFNPEVYGLFSLAFLVLSLFVAFSSFGLTEGILRYTAYYRGKKDSKKIVFILNFSIIFIVISSLISAFLLFFLSSFISISIFHNASLIPFLKFFSFLVPIWIFSNLFLAVIRAYELVSYYSFILNVLESIVKILFLGFFIILGLKTNAIIFSAILGITSMFIASYLVCKYKLKVFGKIQINKNEKKALTKELFSYSLPFMLLLFLDLSFQWTDSFFLGFFKTASDVGYYNSAIPIALLLNLTADIFMILFYPLITREFAKKNFSLIKQISRQIGKWIFILNLPILIIFLFYPKEIISLLFGNQYAIASNALQFLAIGVFISAIFRPAKFIIASIGKSKLMLVNVAIVFVFSIILNILLIPYYGINGAAISAMLSYALLSLLFLFEAYYFTSILAIRADAIKIFFVSLVPIFALFVIKNFMQKNIVSILMQVIFFFLLYFLLIFLARCLDKKDILIITSMTNKLGLKAGK